MIIRPLFCAFLLACSACGASGELTEDESPVVITGAAIEGGVRFHASDIRADSELGAAIAVSGDTAVVGAPSDDRLGTDAGAAYVYRIAADGTWIYEARLSASTPHAGDRFGHSVAIEGNVIVVGAPYASSRGTAAGLAYVYTRSGSTWSGRAALRANDGASGDHFGWSVATHGGWVWVGAPLDDNEGHSNRGAVYIFAKGSFPGWALSTKIVPTNAMHSMWFGYSVALSATHGVAGAPTEGRGAAYLYTRPGVFERRFTSNLVSTNAGLGSSVAIDGESILAGAPTDTHSTLTFAGSAVIFRRSIITGNWEHLLLRADAPQEGAFFGASVAFGSGYALAGAPGEDGKVSDSGAGYLYFVGRSVLFAGRLGINNAPGAELGTSAAIGSSSDVFLGAPRTEHNELTGAGMVTAFHYDGAAWLDDHRAFAAFPRAVNELAIDGDVLAVGFDGQIDVYQRGDRSFSHLQTIQGPTNANFCTYGSSIAIDGDTMVIDAYFCVDQTSYPQGFVDVFHRSGYRFAHTQTLVPQFTASGEHSSVREVSVRDGDTILLGAYRMEGGRGRAALWQYDGTTWTQTAELTSPMTWNLPQCPVLYDTNFSYRHAIDGDTMVIGEPGFGGGSAACAVPGLLHVYRRSVSGAWSFEQSLSVSNFMPGVVDELGYSVALRGDLLGARSRTNVYLFERTGMSWTLSFQQPAIAGLASISLSDDRFVFDVEESGQPARVEVWSRATNTWESTIEAEASDSGFTRGLWIDGERIVATGTDRAYLFSAQ